MAIRLLGGSASRGPHFKVGGGLGGRLRVGGGGRRGGGVAVAPNPFRQASRLVRRATGPARLVGRRY